MTENADTGAPGRAAPGCPPVGVQDGDRVSLAAGGAGGNGRRGVKGEDVGEFTGGDGAGLEERDFRVRSRTLSWARTS